MRSLILFCMLTLSIVLLGWVFGSVYGAGVEAFVPAAYLCLICTGLAIHYAEAFLEARLFALESHE